MNQSNGASVLDILKCLIKYLNDSIPYPFYTREIAHSYNPQPERDIPFGRSFPV